MSELSGLQAAFLGDAVFSLLTREHVIKTPRPVGEMHKAVKDIICAGAQAAYYRALEPLLTERELLIMRNGRNTNIKSRSKNANMIDYRHATGVEALFGRLWADGEKERCAELFGVCLEAAGYE